MKIKECCQTMNALTDVTRLRILNLLGEGELCVCDLMGVLKEPQSKVSRHLGYLRRAGLVEARKEGLWMHYRLAAPASKALRGILSALKAGLAECEDCRRDLAELKRSKDRLVGCCP